MRRLNRYTNINKLFITIISTVCIMLVLTFVLSFGGEDKSKITKTISKFKLENKQQVEKKQQVDKMDINKKYKLKSEPQVRVYFVNEKVVRAMPLEEYVRGVVSAEMPAEFHIEALKAQAVAARTYVLAHMKGFGDNQYNKRLNADVCDSVQSQVFMPKNKRINSWPKSKRNEYWNKIEESVNSTKGNVLVYNNEIVMAPYYFATSNGKTENSENVFNSEVPYLKSVESPGEEKAPKFKSIKKFSYDEFIKIIKKQYPKCNVNKKNIGKQMVIKEKTPSGSIKRIKIGNVEIKGTEFRKILGLNSSKFSLEFKGNHIIVNCNGYGHNVGMSQWGANGMGKSGKKYDYILKHYYKGVDIETLKYKN
ncbi:stage II sporulation protein D [Clostridium sp. Marseille-Q2269]|uniref:stage II sporulation protein D n=1 Tax=Clostridium sp. Marseille-Q2269 TaxID=2942205 RepID=UPI002072A4A0|nr:stage II sporulation protein D [Clostridium sp. Marseille-Q2269]